MKKRRVSADPGGKEKKGQGHGRGEILINVGQGGEKCKTTGSGSGPIKASPRKRGEGEKKGKGEKAVFFAARRKGKIKPRRRRTRVSAGSRRGRKKNVRSDLGRGRKKKRGSLLAYRKSYAMVGRSDPDRCPRSRIPCIASVWIKTSLPAHRKKEDRTDLPGDQCGQGAGARKGKIDPYTSHGKEGRGGEEKRKRKKKSFPSDRILRGGKNQKTD